MFEVKKMYVELIVEMLMKDVMNFFFFFSSSFFLLRLLPFFSYIYMCVLILF